MAEAAADAKEEEKEEDRLGAGGRGGHAVKNQPELSEEERKIQTAVMEHQSGAARLSQAEDARSLVAYNSGYAVLSTLSSTVEGYPSGSLVGFAHDERGLPVFCFSAMSGHTKDLQKGGKAALTVTAKGFEGAADGRVALIGDVERVSKAEVEEGGLRELYRSRHPNAFWVDFGDFTFYRMKELKAVNFVGGFARAGSISAEEYMAATIDPIQAFAAPVMKHMNDDHSESTIAMVMHYIGLPQVEKAELVQLDRLGFMVQITRLGQTFKLRLPFPRAAEDRKDVKTLIVEMTRASLANEAVQAAMQEMAAQKAEAA
eukprot:CAMPEP_0174737544 /NCGR_PEP_ID=MMETSP1094-20130205/68474_1 /TAXON_ID=156173 /ORGANISM="Chrysochromulina brevifilum, Strain UTEX LB 985" /LENGTH=315 /DNA_ID=CAMNT_0015940787 /DNA_START=195 /DNA_END=1142 /DNA_ORIENTATION=+